MKGFALLARARVRPSPVERLRLPLYFLPVLFPFLSFRLLFVPVPPRSDCSSLRPADRGLSSRREVSSSRCCSSYVADLGDAEHSRRK